MVKPRSRASSKTSTQITVAFLKKLGACKDAVAEFKARGKAKMPASAVLNILIKEKKRDWFSWLATHLMTHKQKVQWAIFCAEQVIEIFERKYPNDDRPRKAIDAAKAWQTDLELETPTPLEEIKQVDRPSVTERIPILIEITEQDRVSAGEYSDSSKCLVATALRRNGYREVYGYFDLAISIRDDGSYANPGMVIDGSKYICADISPDCLFYTHRGYGKQVVGKQIILYPV